MPTNPISRIRLRRGNKSAVDASELMTYEIAYAKDTKEVYIYDGATKNLVGKAMTGLASARPSAGVPGRWYFATDTSVASVDSGSTWTEVTADVTNMPTTAQKAALVGTSGTPGSGNKFVTDQDPRLSSPSTGSFSNITAGTAGAGTYTLPATSQLNVSGAAAYATLGSDLVTQGDMDTASAWTNGAGWFVDYVSAVAVNAAGTGYATGDIIQVTGGSGSGCYLRVTASGGAVTGVAIIDAGSGYDTTTGAATTKVSGSGDNACTINITVTSKALFQPNAISTVAVNAAGSGYAQNDVLTVDGPGTDGAVTVTSVDGSGGVTGVSVLARGASYTTPYVGASLASSGAPSAAYGGAAAYDYVNNKLYTHGGIDGSTYRSEFRLYDVAANTWSTPTENGTPPSDRYSHNMVYIPDTGSGAYLLLFGGRTGSSTFSNDIYKYDITSSTWSLVSVSGTPHPASSNNSMVYDPDTHALFVLGYYNGSYTCAFNKFDIATATWSSKSITYLPGTKTDSALVYSSGYIYAIFGAVNGTWGNTAQRYTVASNTWTPLTPAAYSSDHFIPGALVPTTYGLDPNNGRVYMWGGRYIAPGTSGTTTTNLVWSFDLATSAVRSFTPSGTNITAKGWAYGTFCYKSGKMVCINGNATGSAGIVEQTSLTIWNEYPTAAMVSPSNMTNNTTPSPYVASCSQNTYGDGYRLFDGSNSTDAGGSGLPYWFKLDFGSGVTVGHYRMYSRYSTDKGPKTWVFQGSNNDSDWTNLDTITSYSWGSVASSWSRLFTISSPGSYRYYRLYITDSMDGNAAIIVSELHLFAPGATIFVTGLCDAPLEQSVGTTANGEYYEITCTATRSAGSFAPQLGGVNGLSVSAAATAAKQYIPTTGNGNLKFTPSADFNGTIDDVVCKKITARTPASKLDNMDMWGYGMVQNIGLDAGKFNCQGGSSIATVLGYCAGKYMVSIGPHTAIGRQALYYSFSPNRCTAVGNNAAMFNLTGAVTAVGDSAAYSNTTGILTAIGEFALTANTTGSGTAVGWCAGYSQTTATGCIYLGHQAGYLNGTSNKLFITNTAANPFLEGTIDTSSTTGTLALRGSFLPSAHNTYNLGSDAVRWDAVYCQDGAFNGSDERLKENIAPTFGTSFVVAMADAAIQYKWKDWEYEEEIPDGEEEYEEIVTEMVEVSQLDEEGSPVLDDDGNPVMVTEEQERTETRTRPITKTDTKYVTYRRHHHGFGAQTVKAILDALEIDTTEFAGYAYNPETDSYSIRASEFIPPLYRAFKELHDRITALEGA